MRLSNRLTILILTAVLSFSVCACGVPEPCLLGTWWAGDSDRPQRLRPASITFYSDGTFTLNRSRGGPLSGRYTVDSCCRVIHFLIDVPGTYRQRELYCVFTLVDRTLTLTNTRGTSFTFQRGSPRQSADP